MRSDELLEKYVSMSLWTIIVGIIDKYVVSKVSQDVSRCLKIPTRRNIFAICKDYVFKI